MSNRPAAVLLLAALSACVPAPDPIDVAFESGDIVVFAVASDEEEPKVEAVGFFVASSASDAKAFVGKSGAPFFIMRVRASDFVGANRELTLAELAAVKVVRADAERSEGHGACGRCLVPSTSPPQIVNDGDSCKLPPFAEGHLYAKSGDGWVERTDASAERAIQAAHRAIRLDWPGTCACSENTDHPSLARMEIRPFAPANAPWPLAAFGQNAQGIIGGVSDRVAIAFDTSATPAPVKTTELDNYPAEVRSAAALRDGSFLFAGERFTEALGDGFRFDRLQLAADGSFLQPQRIDTSAIARPISMKYLAPSSDFPLWLIGRAAGDFNVAVPALFACRDTTVQCMRANIDLLTCTGDQLSLGIQDAVILPDGSGVAVADRALFYKSPNGRTVEPEPQDQWTCTIPDRAFRWRPGVSGATDPVLVKPLRGVAAIGSRVFVCGHREPPRCMPYYPVVLTATVSAMPGETPQPDLEIVARGPDYVQCKSFHPVPGRPELARVLLSNGHIIDFDANGNEVARTQIGERFTSSALPWQEIRPLETGNLLVRSRENGLYLGEGTAPFEQIYGGMPPEGAGYNVVIATETGFLAFGHPRGIARIELERDPGSPKAFPVPRVSFIADPSGALAPSDHVRDAVIDRASTESNPGALVLLVAGYSDGRPIAPLLRRIRIDARTATTSEIGTFADVITPSSIDGLAIDGVTEVGLGRFTAIVQDTRIIQIAGDVAEEVVLDFDAKDTSTIEVKPALSPDECSGNPRRLDAWQDIDGANGVAWAVGDRGLIMRVVGGRAERFVPMVEETIGMPMPVEADLATVRATCPDRALIAGIYDRAGGDAGRALHVWKIAPRGAPREECFPSSATPTEIELDETLEVREVPEDFDLRCLNIPPASPISYAYPRLIVADGPSAALVLENSYVHRFEAETPVPGAEVRTKAPFTVYSAAQNARGEILFGGHEARMALGVPAGP